VLTMTALAERQLEDSSAAMAENCANDDGAGREADNVMEQVIL
jgi:hypothetical protein